MRGMEPCLYPDLKPLSSYRKGCHCERCRAGNAAYQRSYYPKAKDAIQARNRRYTEANREQVLAQRAAFRETNRERLRQSDRAYYAAHPELRRAHSLDSHYRHRPERLVAKRRRHLADTHGITPDDYQRMLDAQGGVCAVCELPPYGKNLMHVDHNHATGKIRGLLHTRCNAQLVGIIEGVFYRTYVDRALAYIDADGVAFPVGTFGEST
jgi:hypothetical protein